MYYKYTKVCHNTDRLHIKECPGTLIDISVKNKYYDNWNY